MNIFYLHHDPRICARHHYDKHVNKMILETAQLLCWAYYKPNGKRHKEVPKSMYLYKYVKSHYNHPCTVWARKTWGNWRWLSILGLYLCKEYTHRFRKIHKTQSLILNLILLNPKDLGILPNNPKITSRPQCFGPYEKECTIPKKPKAAYRKYYRIGKKHLQKYTNRPYPKYLIGPYS